MPQARLPDVNTAFITYRRESLVALKSYDYRGCWGALNCINALLPKKYRVILDNIRYDEKSKISFIYCCGLCSEQIDQSDVHIFDYVLDELQFLALDEKTVKVWRCPECNEINYLSNTEIIKDMLAQPSFLQTVPLPPKRQNGLLGRMTYRKEFSKWAWNFLNELEERMAQFRDDNWSKEDEYTGDDEIDTSEEEGVD